MEGEVEVLEPCQLEISGEISGSFYHVSGIAVYVDDVAINTGTGTNRCHVDCMKTRYFGTGSNSYIVSVPYDTTTDILTVGVHTIKIGVICKWAGTKRTMYINNRSDNDMASSSCLIVKEL